MSHRRGLALLDPALVRSTRAGSGSEVSPSGFESKVMDSFVVWEREKRRIRGLRFSPRLPCHCIALESIASAVGRELRVAICPCIQRDDGRVLVHDGQGSGSALSLATG